MSPFCAAGMPSWLAAPDSDRVIVDPDLAKEWDPRLDGRRSKRALFWIALTAANAYRWDMAGHLVSWAVDSGWLAEGMAALEARSVLVEAVSNAVIHGTLKLPGLSGFEGDTRRMLQAIDTRLADPRWGKMPVLGQWRRSDALLIAHVEDCGSGHALPGKQTPEIEGVSGRGHCLMRVMARRLRFSRNGARVTAGFALRRDRVSQLI